MFGDGSDSEFRLRRVRGVLLYVCVADTPFVKNRAVLGDEYRAVEITALLIPGNEVVDPSCFRCRRILRGNENRAENRKDEGTSPLLIHDRENM